MSTDQFITFLAAISWPLTALIVGVFTSHVAYLVINMAVDAHNDRMKAARRAENRANDYPFGRITRMSERALEFILQAQGAFPGKPKDDVGRQIVREVRKMYSELNRPTDEPEHPESNSADPSYPDPADLDDEEDF